MIGLKRFLFTVLAGLLLFHLGSCKSEDDSSDSTTSSDVTLSGSMQDASAQIQKNLTKAITYTDYVLYCVTFTSPPEAGSGAFDATGSFSVTLANAAGLAVGCFINDAATNEPITTLTFQTGDTSGLGSGDTSSAAIKGGAHTITIVFDPVNKTATADISAIIDTTAVDTDATSGGITPDDITGDWTLSCATEAQGNSAEELDQCVAFLSDVGSGSIPIYTEVLSGTEANGDKVYAMAPWESAATFQACGSAEALVNVVGVSGITGTISGTKATTAFNGLMKDANYDSATNSMLATDLQTYLSAKTIPSMSGLTCAATVGALNLSGWEHRECMLRYLEEQSSDSCMLRAGSAAWSDFVGNNGSTIVFDSHLGGASPSIQGRYDLMGLEFMGNTAVASSFNEYNYDYWDGSSSQSCTGYHELSIVITKETATTAFGRFTQKEGDSCDSTRNRYSSFFTTWVK